MKKRIGLMGGTFNPIHNGHLILAQEAKEQYDLDEIWFLPSKRPPHKDNRELPKDEIRLEMLYMAVESNPFFSVSLLEMNRTKEKTYTYDTMLELKEKYPDTEFYFIIGADSLFYLDKWYGFKELLKGMVFLTAPRSGLPKNWKENQNFISEPENFLEEGSIVMEEMKKIASDYKEKYQAKIYFIEMPLIEISSTELREKAKTGQSLKYYLPDCVEEYIREKKIYD